jgi:hypothetical protein
MFGERRERGKLSMSIETRHINRLAALSLSGDAYREVLAIISEIASVDEARRERQRHRKDKSRQKQESCPVTVTGQARDMECESHVTEARTVTGQGRDEVPRTPKEEKLPSVPTEPQAPTAPMDRGEASEEIGYFRRGKQVLGENAGGLLASLRKHRGNIALARATIETASTKENPREYLARILRGEPTGPPEKGIINARATGII